DAKLRDAFEPAYILERELTGGGMSRVFLATERALNRQVVIKVLPPELAAGVNRERFRREVQLAAQLQHPHIVPLYAAGEHGDLLYYTTPAAQMPRNPQPVGRKRPDAPPALTALVMKCLAKMPEQRPQHASELVAAFDAMSLGAGDHARAAHWRRWGVALAVVAATVVSIVLWRQGRPGAPAATGTVTKRAPRGTAAPPAASVSLTQADSLAIARA